MDKDDSYTLRACQNNKIGRLKELLEAGYPIHPWCARFAASYNNIAILRLLRDYEASFDDPVIVSNALDNEDTQALRFVIA